MAEAWQAGRGEVAFAETFVADSADFAIRGIMQDGNTVALRDVLVHVIEEYAPHCRPPAQRRERKSTAA